jgi:putative transposase
MRLATKAKRLTRELLEQTTVLFAPDTILASYRKLIAQKYDGSKNRQGPGRPQISQEIDDLVIRFKEESPRWGYTRIRDYLVYLGYRIGKTMVKSILLKNGYDPEPDLTRKTTWKEFLKGHWNVSAASNLFSIELFVKGKLVRYMVLVSIHYATRKVEVVGIIQQAHGKWMSQNEGTWLIGSPAF